MAGNQTAELVKETVAEMVRAKAAIDADWAAGKRDGMRANTFGVADATQKMLAALEADDPDAFTQAAQEARQCAYVAQLHGSNWKRSRR